MNTSFRFDSAKKYRYGFTLLEILLVIAMLAIFVGIIIVAINPTNQIRQTQVNQKLQVATSLQLALDQYEISTGSYPEDVEVGLYKDICDSDPSDDCADISGLQPRYISTLPSSEEEGVYQVAIHPTNRGISIRVVGIDDTVITSINLFEEGLADNGEVEEEDPVPTIPVPQYSDGTIDTSFDIGTGFTDPSWQFTNALAELDDGKILVGGWFTVLNGTPQNRLVRLNSDGSIDSTFTIGSGFNGSVETVAVQDDGKILVGGGFTAYNGVTRNGLARLESNGALDTSFNIGLGFQPFTPGGSPRHVYSIVVQDDGKIVVAGAFGRFDGNLAHRNLVRLNSNGSLDTAFQSQVGSGPSAGVYSMVLQDDGKIVLGGDFGSYNGVTRNRIVRIDPTGQIDTSFNTGQGFTHTSSSYSAQVNEVVLQPDGKVLVGGTYNTFNGNPQSGFTRLNSNGSLDTTLNLSGTYYLRTVAVQSDGKILLGGYSVMGDGSIRTLTRIDSNGGLDSSFNIGTGFNYDPSSLYILSNKRLLVGGAFTTYQGQPHNRLLRLTHPDNVDE